MRISDWSSDVCSSDLLRMTACGRDEFVSIVRTDGGKMLVAGDFSDSDQSQANHHSSSHFYLSDIYASYLSRIALSTDSGHGLKLCIEKDIYGRRGENAARRQGRAAVACLVRQSGQSGYDGTLSRTLSELWFQHRRIAVGTADPR